VADKNKEPEIYHRSFLEYIPPTDPCQGVNCHKPNPAQQKSLEPTFDFSRFREPEPKFLQDFRNQTMGPQQPSSPAAPPSRPPQPYYGPHVYDAVFDDTTPTKITDKADQKFSDYATPWELDNSRLCGAASARFTPVVNLPDRMVVGYYARIPGGQLIAPAGAVVFTDVKATIQNGPVFYCQDPSPPSGWNWVGANDDAYAVITTIDGEVIQGQTVAHRGADAYGIKDYVEVALFVSDVVTVAGISVSLARAGTRKLAQVMVRRSARRATLSGATSEVAALTNSLERRRLAKAGAGGKPPGGVGATPAGSAGRGRLFAQATKTPTTTLPAGEGFTTKYGDVTYSSLGSAKDVALARYHESVHSFLSPKLNVLRTMRANFGQAAYDNSQLVKYIEEALAETFAQVKVNGVKGFLNGIAFPVKYGYVTVGRVVTEAAVATIVVGGTTYGVYYAANK
jgi:hypothetical protein